MLIFGMDLKLRGSIKTENPPPAALHGERSANGGQYMDILNAACTKARMCMPLNAGWLSLLGPEETANTEVASRQGSRAARRNFFLLAQGRILSEPGRTHCTQGRIHFFQGHAAG